MSTPKDRKCRRCPAQIYRDNVTGLCQECFNRERSASTGSSLLAADRERERTAYELSVATKKLTAAMTQIKTLERQVKAINVLNESVETFEITPSLPSGKAEGTVFMVASDWHVEERVDPRTVNQLNDFNLDIAEERATTFFKSGLRLTRLLQQDIAIHTAVVPLLGDFISNDIHEEIAEVAQLEPMHAITFARNLIVSGFKFLLENSELNLIVPCHTGNHGRTTKTTRLATENGHSLEYLMYLHLADYFRDEPRIKFIISEGYHSFLEVYGKTIRFHHGHMVKFQGGVGGITIPVNKAIGQWDKARPADMDIFGHFHQLVQNRKWICNGSLIGYNSYALGGKFDYEPPQQTLFLLDKQRGRTCTWPILFKR